MAVEDVVAQHQCGRIVADEVLTDQEGLREPIGGGLHGIAQIDSPLLAVA